MEMEKDSMLNLYWKDNNENTYMLGTLYKNDDKYYFDINEEGLKQATHHGCYGVGELNLLYNNHPNNFLHYRLQNNILQVMNNQKLQLGFSTVLLK